MILVCSDWLILIGMCTDLQIAGTPVLDASVGSISGEANTRFPIHELHIP